MIAALDVQYASDRAFVACITFEHWTDADPNSEHTTAVHGIGDYQPGEFYRRELPPLLAGLELLPALPSIVVIDAYVWLDENGRKGLGAHLYEALEGKAAVVGVAKGPDRDAGREHFFMPGKESFRLESRDPVLYYLQRLRDETHRFAIGTHRARRSKAIGRSQLDEVPGIGPRRKRALLHHFGSVRGIQQAGLADLEAVEGISATVARKIYDHFREDG